MSRQRILWVSACLLVFSSTIPLPTRGLAWNFLGNKRIDGTRDHERIEIRRPNSAFQSIQLRVSGDAIFFDRVVVHFGDGKSEELVVHGRIWPGARTQIIARSDESRVVESVELWYYQELWKHNPTVILYGS